jgi:hypothetical protein
MSIVYTDQLKSRSVGPVQVSDDLTVSGVTTVTGGVVGNVTGTATGLSGSPSVTVTDITAQNIVAVGATFTGTVSYEDIKNLDSAGIVTARGGLQVGPITGIAATINVGGDISCGIITATSFDGVITGVDISSGGSFLGAGVTSINWASGATVTSSGAGATITIAAGITTTSAYAQSGMISLNLGSGQAHEITLAAGISTFTCTGGTVGDSHSLIITQPSSGITTVGFSTYFLWPSGSAPNLSQASAGSQIDLVTFVVKQETLTGTGVTQLLASAGQDYQ